MNAQIVSVKRRERRCFHNSFHKNTLDNLYDMVAQIYFYYEEYMHFTTKVNAQNQTNLFFYFPFPQNKMFTFSVSLYISFIL